MEEITQDLVQPKYAKALEEYAKEEIMQLLSELNKAQVTPLKEKISSMSKELGDYRDFVSSFGGNTLLSRPDAASFFNRHWKTIKNWELSGILQPYDKDGNPITSDDNPRLHKFYYKFDILKIIINNQK